MTTQITRVTIIKVPSEEDIPIVLKGFETFAKTQQRNGVPYILSMQAGPANGSMREQGYTFVAKAVFKNKEDMEFYETNCEAHQAYKVYLKENATLAGLATVIFTPSLSFDF